MHCVITPVLWMIPEVEAKSGLDYVVRKHVFSNERNLISAVGVHKVNNNQPRVYFPDRL